MFKIIKIVKIQNPVKKKTLKIAKQQLQKLKSVVLNLIKYVYELNSKLDIDKKKTDEQDDRAEILPTYKSEKQMEL